MIRYLCYLSALILFPGCSSTTDKQPAEQDYFFDLKGYFEEQASKLQNQTVRKTVKKNGASETKSLTIDDWKQEIQLFTESDINKAAWKNSYRKDSTANELIYKATDPELRVRLIKINFDKKSPTKIEIHTQSKNLLYHTTEDLTFIPDSLYQIKKHQKVLILGLNNYEIIGRF